MFLIFGSWAWLIWLILLFIFLLLLAPQIISIFALNKAIKSDKKLHDSVFGRSDKNKEAIKEENSLIGKIHEDNLEITLPLSYRKRFTGNVVIHRGKNNCLSLYNELEWERILRTTEKLPKEGGTRDFALLMCRGGERVKISNDGKLTIPGYLKEYAKLNGEVIFIEVGPNKLELWATEEFHRNKEKHLNKQKHERGRKKSKN